MSLSQLPSFYQRGNVDLRGPPGPPGQDGAQGPAGPQGEPGRDGRDGPADPEMNARVRAVEDDLGDFKARVGDTFTAITTETEAFAQRVQTVEASYVSEGEVDLKVSAAIRDEQTARSTAVAAVATRVSTIEADYTKGGDVDLKVNAKVSEEAQARADAVSAVASRVSALEASTGSGGDGTDPVARAAIEEEKRVRADAISAEASARQDLAATLRGETSAAVSQEAQARSDAVSAEASSRTALGATLRREVGAVGVSPPSDFRLAGTFWRQGFNWADDRPSDLTPAWTFNGETLTILNEDRRNGIYDTAHLASVRLSPGRRRRLTAVWRVIYAGELPDAKADMFFIGLNGVKLAIYTPAINLTIFGGQPGWGVETGTWQRAVFEINDDDLIAQGCVYVRGLFRMIARGAGEQWELQSLSLDDITIEASITAKVSAEEKARADADGALASRVSSVEARFVGGGDVDQRVSAKVSEEATARANQDGALASRIDQVVLTYNDVFSTTIARIAAEETARANQDGALASRIDTVEATANGAKASVQTVQQAVAGVDGRQEVYWGVTGTLPDGKVAIGLRKKDGSAGEFLVETNMRVTGDVMIDGTLTTRTIAPNQITTTAYAVNNAEQVVYAGTAEQPRNLVSTTIVAAGSEPYLVNVSADFGASAPTVSYLYFRILRDGVVIYGPLTIRPTAYGTYGVTFGGMLATSVVDTPGPGAHTYTLQLYSDQSQATWTSSYKIMTATAFKR